MRKFKKFVLSAVVICMACMSLTACAKEETAIVTDPDCPYCNDTGICSTCNGGGTKKLQTIDKYSYTATVCPDCRGTITYTSPHVTKGDGKCSHCDAEPES